MTSREERNAMFWAKVDMSGDCWLWTGATAKGYGRFGVGYPKVDYAHRYSHRAFVGPIPEGMSVLHRCDQPLCVRPDHLFVGTHMDNMRDRWGKGRGRGVLLADEQVALIRKRALAGERGCDLAAEYGVSRALVTRIKQGTKRVNPEAM